MIAILALIWGCAEPPPPAVDPIFVRGGLIVPAGQGQGQALPEGKVLISRDWRPGETVTVAETQAIAPKIPECVPLWHAPLGDVSRLIAMGGEAPDTALSWSPDGSLLAAGAYTGELVVLDGWSGEELARRSLAEGMVKRLAWSADGQTLYAAEQSPDAFLWALNPRDLTERWRVRLADEVGSSTPPPGEDLYGVYTLPTAYGLTVLPSGELLVATGHAWNEGETRYNRGRMLIFDARGQRVRAWPEATADAVFFEPRLDPESGLAIAPVNRSATGPPPADLPVDGAAVLRLPELTPVATMVPEPLSPWFKEAFLWEAVDVSAEAGVAMLGLGDGRVQLWPLAGGEPTVLTPGAPVLAGEVPIAASVGFGLLHEDAAVFITSNTNIPYGAAAPDLRPPSAHPGENTLWVYGLDGALRWTWRGEQRLAGTSVGPDGRTLVVGAGPRVADGREDLYGALLFDLGGEARGGQERLLAFCPTESPVFFRQALSADGRVAVAEVPTRGADGGVRGAYRVTVLR